MNNFSKLLAAVGNCHKLWQPNECDVSETSIENNKKIIFMCANV